MFKVVSINPLKIVSLKPGRAFWNNGGAFIFPEGRTIDVLEIGPNGEWIVYRHRDRYIFIEPPLLMYSEAQKKVLFGLHGRADGRLEEPDLAVIRLAKVEAVKLLSTASPNDVDRLRAINPQMFIMVRMYANFKNRIVSPDDFASWMAGDLRPFYERGILHYEVHNEPNLAEEGWKSSWRNGHEFAAWFMRVRQNLVAVYPEMKFGFPGLSPNGIVIPDRTDDKNFFGEADLAVRSADFVCSHAYWTNGLEMKSPNGGMSWTYFRDKVPGKEHYITECSNPSPLISQVDRGHQYLEYHRLVERAGGVKALFFFVVSASSGFEHETWRDENGILKGTVLTVANGRKV